jgi:hypothetical protein
MVRGFVAALQESALWVVAMYDIPEDEGANTNESDCQPNEDFQQKQTSELAKTQLPLGTQGRNQKQVRDRRSHAARRLEGVRQSCQNQWRLVQRLEAVHGAPDSPANQDANAPTRADGCDRARG